MAVYVIAIAAVVLLLAVSYRAFGGGEQQSPLPLALLRSAQLLVEGNVDALSTVIADLPMPPPEQSLRAGRRGAAALQQHLDRLPAHQALSESESPPASLLQAAGQDLAWAWRMLATPGVEANRGLCEALIALRDHALDCARTTAPLLAAALVEPAQGAGEPGLERDGWRPSQ